MKKKKTTDQILSQASKKKSFIAIDKDIEQLIGIGSLADLKHMIQCYADEQGYDAEAAEDLIMVYELGPAKEINAAHRGLEIYIED